MHLLLGHDVILGHRLASRRAPSRPRTYVVYLVFSKQGTIGPIHVALIQRDAERLAWWFDRKKDAGEIVDYYLGPPPPNERTRFQELTPLSFRLYVDDLLELERWPSE